MKDGKSFGTARPTWTAPILAITPPNKVIRKTLFELSTADDAGEETQRILDDLTVEQYESLILGRATADFLDNAVYGKLVGDFDSLTFPDPQDDASLVGDRIPVFQQGHSCQSKHNPFSLGRVAFAFGGLSTPAHRCGEPDFERGVIW